MRRTCCGAGAVRQQPRRRQHHRQRRGQCRRGSAARAGRSARAGRHHQRRGGRRRSGGAELLSPAGHRRPHARSSCRPTRPRRWCRCSRSSSFRRSRCTSSRRFGRTGCNQAGCNRPNMLRTFGLTPPDGGANAMSRAPSSRTRPVGWALFAGRRRVRGQRLDGRQHRDRPRPVRLDRAARRAGPDRRHRHGDPLAGDHRRDQEGNHGRIGFAVFVWANGNYPILV